MDMNLIKSIASGSVTPTIGKYTKDGQDLDYVLTFQTFDPMTGAAQSNTHESISRAWIENEIATREAELNNPYSLLSVLEGENVTVLADYTAA